MNTIREGLVGRRIVDVRFCNEVDFIAITLVLSDGDTYFLSQPSLELDVIRGQFSDVLTREYFIDYPDRKPAEQSFQ